jgi:hypothetical protein
MKFLFFFQSEFDAEVAENFHENITGMDVPTIQRKIVRYTVAAESFYTCSSKIRLFTVYWRMVLAYGRG